MEYQNKMMTTKTDKEPIIAETLVALEQLRKLIEERARYKHEDKGKEEVR